MADSADLIARYAALCETADRLADTGWRSVGEDGLKRRHTVTAPVLDRFADYMFGGIGFEVGQDFFGIVPSNDGTAVLRPKPDDRQRAEHRELVRSNLTRAETLFDALGIPPETWFELVRADNVVGGLLLQVKLQGRPVVVSNHTIRVSSRAPCMREALGGIPPSVMEIGGGHGRFVRDVLTLAPETRITYSDLPFNLLLAARYLTRVFPGDVHLAWGDAPIPSDARIVIVPPWRLADIPYPVDVCCNFLSFQHMQPDNLAYYGAVFRRLGIRSIYHVNRSVAFQPQEVPLDAYPFRDAYETRSRRVMSRANALTMLNDAVQSVTPVDQIEELLVLRPA